MKDTLTLNLSKSPISTNENGYVEISRKEFWIRFLRITQDLSNKELDVLSDLLVDNELGKVPYTVYKSLETKGYLIDKKLSNQLEMLKKNLVSNKYKLIFNYEIREE